MSNQQTKNTMETLAQYTAITTAANGVNVTATAAAQMQKASERNANTAAAMATDDKKFCEYCAAVGNQPTAAALLEYLLNLSATSKISTLRRKFATLSQLYPVSADQRKAINATLRRLAAAQSKESNRARRHESNADGTAARDFSTKQAAAVNGGEIARIIASISGDTIKGQRDKTLFTVAFYAGLRSSELLAIRRENIKVTDAGNIEIELLDTKTAANAKVYIYNRAAIEQLKRFISATPTAGDYLFTAVDKYDHATAQPITRQSWHRIVKHYAPTLQTHSFRRGAITQIIRNGCDIAAGMQFSRHTSKASFLRYLDTAASESTNGGKYL